MSLPATGSTARAACSRETTPSRLGSSSSANMTGVWNCSPSSLMVASPTSTGTILPSAVSGGSAHERWQTPVNALNSCAGATEEALERVQRLSPLH